MAIQVVPIIKAIAPVISTAGSMYSEWQRRRDPPPGGAAATPVGGLHELQQRLQRLEATSAENSHLIAQLAEQLREVAMQLEEVALTVEQSQANACRIAYIAVAAGLIAAALGVWAVLAA